MRKEATAYPQKNKKEKLAKNVVFYL